MVWPPTPTLLGESSSTLRPAAAAAAMAARRRLSPLLTVPSTSCRSGEGVSGTVCRNMASRGRGGQGQVLEDEQAQHAQQQAAHVAQAATLLQQLRHPACIPAGLPTPTLQLHAITRPPTCCVSANAARPRPAGSFSSAPCAMPSLSNREGAGISSEGAWSDGGAGEGLQRVGVVGQGNVGLQCSRSSSGGGGSGTLLVAPPVIICLAVPISHLFHSTPNLAPASPSTCQQPHGKLAGCGFQVVAHDAAARILQGAHKGLAVVRCMERLLFSNGGRGG